MVVDEDSLDSTVEERCVICLLAAQVEHLVPERNQIKQFVQQVILDSAKPVLVLRLQESGHLFYWIPEQEGRLNRESTEP